MASSEFAAAPVRSTFARVLGFRTEETGWRRGAEGEELVAQQLAEVEKKDPRWVFLHSVPVGDRGSDIDHLAIGPGGVFTINAKHHRGKDVWAGGNTLMVDGHRTAYVRNSRHEATRASRLLSERCGFEVPVMGLVVVVNAKSLTVKAQPKDVHVLRREHLSGWLLRLGPVLGDDALTRVYALARRSTTWR